MYFQTHSRTAKAPQIQDAINTLAGFAKHEGETHEVALRVAKAPGDGYLLDCCNETWQAIHLTSKGYQVIDRPPVRFRRPKLSRPLNVPDRHGTLDDLRAIVNIAQEDLVLLVPTILEALRIDTAYPITEIVGDQGSAKSTTQETITGLLDQKVVGLRARPKSTEDFFIAAKNNHILGYNNLSNLSADFQDAMCCLATGGGYAGRKLYTDDEESVFDAKRPIFMNGIVRLATQADALSRTVRLRCPKLGHADRISDQDFANRLEKHGAGALHYLLSTFCRALAVLPEVKLEKAPRLMDFAKLGVAVAQVMAKDDPELFSNVDGEPFMVRYQAQLDGAVQQSLESSPAIQALVEWVDVKGGQIDSTVGELHTDLKDMYGYRKPGWPLSAKGFRDCLDRASPALAALGIEVSYPPNRRNGQRIIVNRNPEDSGSALHDSLTPVSPPSRMTFLEVLMMSNREAREEREARERYPRPRFEPTEEDFEEMKFWSSINDESFLGDKPDYDSEGNYVN